MYPNTGGVPAPSYKNKLRRPRLKMSGGIGLAKPGIKSGIRAQKPKPAPTPAATAPKPPIETLNDSGYNIAAAGANRDYGNAMAGLGMREQQLRSDYGFDADYASNPYTRANLLASAYNKAFSGTGNTYAARGQLYSGALDRARAYDADNYQRSLYEARGDYDREMAGLESDRLDATNARAGAMDKAYGEMLDRYLDKDLDPTLYPGAEKGGAKGGGKKGGGSKGKKGGGFPVPVEIQHPVGPGHPDYDPPRWNSKTAAAFKKKHGYGPKRALVKGKRG